MRRFVLGGLILTAVLFAVGCEDSDTSNILEPSFAKAGISCDAMNGPISQGSILSKQEMVDTYIYPVIEDVFDEKRSQNAAQGHVNNIIREICQEPPNWDGAMSFVHTFVQQVDGQPDDKLDERSVTVADLVNRVILLATDPQTLAFEIPAGAFEYEGGLAVVDPSLGTGVVSTRNKKVFVDPENFVGSSPFIVALSQTTDPDNTRFTPFSAVFGDVVYLIDSSGDPDPDGEGVLIVMCVTEDQADHPAFNHLQIAHSDENGTTLLKRVPTQGLCDQASESPNQAAGAFDSGPQWLRSVGRFAGRMVRKALGPEPLYARYFRETGLGGRTKVFSPFTPVDPYATLSLDVTPDAATVDVGEEVPFTAELIGPPEAKALVGTLSFTWESGNGNWIDVDPNGLAEGRAETGIDGTNWVSATVDGFPWLSDAASVTVNPLPTPSVQFDTYSIGEYGQDDQYFFSTKEPDEGELNVVYPAFLFYPVGDGSLCGQELAARSSLELIEDGGDNSILGTWCTANGVPFYGQYGFSMKGAPPSSVFIELYDQFAGDAGKTYGSSDHAAAIEVDDNDLAVSVDGDGGGTVACTLASEGSTGSCTPPVSLKAWQDVILTANPDKWSRFVEWTGTCMDLGNGECAFRMRVDRQVTATFELIYAPLTVTSSSWVPGTLEVTYSVDSGPENLICSASTDSENSCDPVPIPLLEGDITLTATPVGYTGPKKTVDIQMFGEIAECQGRTTIDPTGSVSCRFTMPKAGAAVTFKLTF